MKKYIIWWAKAIGVTAHILALLFFIASYASDDWSKIHLIIISEATAVVCFVIKRLYG